MMSAGIRRTLVILVVLITFVASAAPAMAGPSGEEAAPANVVSDVLILRPLGIATTGLGAAMFVVTLPILAVTAPTQIGVPFGILVKRPVRYVWADELGTH
jgi:hypothetical protein